MSGSCQCVCRDRGAVSYSCFLNRVFRVNNWLKSILYTCYVGSCPDGIMQAELHDGNEWNICEEMINLNLASREFKNWLPNVPSASADQQSIVYIPS